MDRLNGMQSIPRPRPLHGTACACACAWRAVVVLALGASPLLGCAGADSEGGSIGPVTGPTTPAPVDPRTLAAYFPPTSGASWDTMAGARLGYDTAALAARAV